MEKRELNAAIKKLAEQIKNGKADPNSNEAASEFKRLYGADKALKSMTAESIRTLLRLNLKYRYEPLHMFGIHIEL